MRAQTPFDYSICAAKASTHTPLRHLICFVGIIACCLFKVFYLIYFFPSPPLYLIIIDLLMWLDIMLEYKNNFGVSNILFSFHFCPSFNL